MVFCYKTITETPRKCGFVSPGRRSPQRRRAHVPPMLSKLIQDEYDDESVLGSIPEREWRLLAALARKREDDVEREKLADQFRRMWQKEKQQREEAEAETSDQFKKYLSEKREQERTWKEMRQLQRTAEQQVRRVQLMDSIRCKEARSRAQRAWVDDQKSSYMTDKALEWETRAMLVAERRSKQEEGEEWRKRLELMYTEQKADEARTKKTKLLKNATQRRAICNSLNCWETSLLRQEISVMDAAKRAHHAAHAALTSARSDVIIRERERKKKRARKIAFVTAQMRHDLKSGHVF